MRADAKNAATGGPTPFPPNWAKMTPAQKRDWQNKNRAPQAATKAQPVPQQPALVPADDDQGDEIDQGDQDATALETGCDPADCPTPDEALHTLARSIAANTSAIDFKQLLLKLLQAILSLMSGEPPQK